MKAHVYVTLKRSVLDAQGQTIAGALRRMQWKGIADVRQGKYFQLTLDDSLAADPGQA
jgi:phosphoribosylformylglycinamidine synthase